MAMFPKIQSPCPYKADFAAIMDGDMCRMCKRQVFDLTAMTDAERVAFFTGCAETEVCVSYRLPIRPVAAATVALATLAMPMAAAAQTAPEIVEIVVGGVTDIEAVEFVEDPADEALPELPVLVEEKAPDQAAPATDALQPLIPVRPAS